MGTRFIATQESFTSKGYSDMIIETEGSGSNFR
jgi:NAD(P)H-dependent flavin oxidoreductase YrpB (nitropropane dioxygenase family)